MVYVLLQQSNPLSFSNLLWSKLSLVPKWQKMSSFFNRLNYVPSKNVHRLIFRTLNATFLEEALNNGIETKVWDERILLDKLVGFSIILRLLSLIQGRKVKSVEGRDSKVDVLIGKKIPHKKSRQPLEPRMYGNRCILEPSGGTQ